MKFKNDLSCPKSVARVLGCRPSGTYLTRSLLLPLFSRSCCNVNTCTRLHLARWHSARWWKADWWSDEEAGIWDFLKLDKREKELLGRKRSEEYSLSVGWLFTGMAFEFHTLAEQMSHLRLSCLPNSSVPSWMPLKKLDIHLGNEIFWYWDLQNKPFALFVHVGN